MRRESETPRRAIDSFVPCRLRARINGASDDLDAKILLTDLSDPFRLQVGQPLLADRTEVWRKSSQPFGKYSTRRERRAN